MIRRSIEPTTRIPNPPVKHAPLDVILYGYDDRGRITLEERSFADLRQLASYLASTEAGHWRWAEVEVVGTSGRREFAHYSADALRSMIVSSSRNPSCN